MSPRWRERADFLPWPLQTQIGGFVPKEISWVTPVALMRKGPYRLTPPNVMFFALPTRTTGTPAKTSTCSLLSAPCCTTWAKPVPRSRTCCGTHRWDGTSIAMNGCRCDCSRRLSDLTTYSRACLAACRCRRPARRAPVSHGRHRDERPTLIAPDVPPGHLQNVHTHPMSRVVTNSISFQNRRDSPMTPDVGPGALSAASMDRSNRIRPPARARTSRPSPATPAQSPGSPSSQIPGSPGSYQAFGASDRWASSCPMRCGP